MIKGNETIKLNGFNPEYMQVVIKVANPNETPDQYYTVKLNVDQNNQTKIMELARPDFLPNDIPLKENQLIYQKIIYLNQIHQLK